MRRPIFLVFGNTGRTVLVLTGRVIALFSRFSGGWIEILEVFGGCRKVRANQLDCYMHDILSYSVDERTMMSIVIVRKQIESRHSGRTKGHVI